METDLRHVLAHTQKALDLVLAIDRVRDVAFGPEAMLSGIVHAMNDYFRTDLCLLFVRNRETGEFDLKVVHERDPHWRRFGVTVSAELGREAMNVDAVTLWEAGQVLPADVLAEVPDTLYLAAVPVFMDEEPLGVLIIARTNLPFDDDDVQLLKIAESQIDSAIIQVHTYHELDQRNKELETIYRFDRIRDQNLPFEDMLNVVLQELCAIIDAEMGFVMLYNPEGERLEMRAITHDDLVHAPAYYELVHRIANEAVRRAELICHQDTDGLGCEVLCVPLILRDEIIGVFGAVNHTKHRRFTSDDRRLLMAIVSQMDTAILESLELRRLRRVLSRSLDPHVLERLLAHPDVDILKGERVLLTVLFADLRGSTYLSEHIAPELLVEFVNSFLGQMTEVLLSYEGTLDKFVGDEVMALFGAPIPQPDHALRAVRVGLAMQAAYASAMEKWQSRGVDAVGLGVGVATGELTVGEIGCERRTDYTVIGPAANLGSRICAVAKTGQVLISAATYELVKDRVEATPVPGMRFKGIEHDVTVYHVTRIVGAG